MKKALIVVDYQNDFVVGSLGFPAASDLDDRIFALLENAEAEGVDIIFTLDTHDDNYLTTQEGMRLPVPHCIEGTDGHGVYGKCADYVDRAVAVFKKPVFGSWELGEFVRGRGYDEVELCGLVSHICVISNAVICRSASPECRIVVRKNCVGSAFEDVTKASFDVMETLQITLI
jgi:Amidases related to nicotinamidase